MNKQKIITSLTLLAACVVVYALFLCTWTGAEFLMEGAVHMGEVDRFVAVAGAYYIVKDAYYYQRQIKGGKKTRGSHEK